MLFNRIRLAAVAAAFIATTLAVPALADGTAADAARGAKRAYTCFGCHGIPNYRNSYPAYHVPKIGGQHEAYLVSALSEYSSGARPHTTMRSQAGSMTEQEIRDVAAYFASTMPAAAADKTVGTPPAAAATCVACHGANGVGITGDYPNLGGQHADYIVQALKAYRKGTRQNAIMNGMAAALSDEDIQAIAHYFAQQSPALSVPKAPR